MPTEEYAIGWYAPDGPAAFEVITDHTGWRSVEPYGVVNMPGCLQGYIESEPGYIRGRTLFTSNPETFGTPGNMLPLPEPHGALPVAILGLIGLWLLWRK